MRKEVYVFTKNNCVILTDPPNLHLWEKSPNAVINPDLSRVVSVPSRFWKLDDNKRIVPMEGKEREERALLCLEGPRDYTPVCYSTIEVPVFIDKPELMTIEKTRLVTVERISWWFIAALVCGGFASGAILARLIVNASQYFR